MSRFAIFVTFCMCALSNVQAWAVAPMLAADLARECAASRGQGDSADPCAIYIGGFLDGAVSTDVRVAQNVAAEFDREETLTERAIRTRVGERMQRYGASVYAEYCIGEPVPIAEVIALIQKHFELSAPGPRELARDAVYLVLRSSYPCRE